MKTSTKNQHICIPCQRYICLNISRILPPFLCSPILHDDDWLFLPQLTGAFIYTLRCLQLSSAFLCSASPVQWPWSQHLIPCLASVRRMLQLGECLFGGLDVRHKSPKREQKREWDTHPFRACLLLQPSGRQRQSFEQSCKMSVCSIIKSLAALRLTSLSA